jgi:competence protein ComFB
MNLKDRYSLETLGNRTQELVFEAIERMIEEGADMCTCEECVTDLAAWTLNHATPRYYTSLLAPLSPDPVRENKMRVEIELALAAGLKKLAQHRHHG